MHRRERGFSPSEQSLSQPEVIVRKDPLHYEELAHAGRAMNNELSAVFMISLVVHGPQNLTSFRYLLSNLHIDQEFVPTGRKQRTDFDHLTWSGFATASRLGKEITFEATELGERLGFLWAGTVADLSTKLPYTLQELLSAGNAFPGSEEKLLELPEGEIPYRRNSTELRLRLIEQIVAAEAKGKLPLSTDALAGMMNADESTILPEVIYNTVQDLASSGVIDYGRKIYDPEIRDYYVYRLDKFRPNLPPAQYWTQRTLSAITYGYARAHAGEPLAASKATRQIVELYPALGKRSKEYLERDISRIFRHFEKQGYLEMHPDYNFGLRLSEEQAQLLSDFVVSLRLMGEGDQSGANKARDVIADPLKVATLLQKWNWK